MPRFKVGAQIQPQHASMDELRRVWREVDAMGADSLWTWDHFYPLYGEPDGPHFEGWTQLAAMAIETERVRFGAMVSCNSYRNPELLADMARTVDHLSAGRVTLGIGAGWFERDYDEYGYPFGTAGSRLADLAAALPRIESRLAVLNPPPVQDPLPILIGGGGEQVTLKLVAQHAHAWNGFGPPERYAHKNAVLDRWCEEVGRDPAEIERTVLIDGAEVGRIDDYLEAGAGHLIVMRGAPFDLSPVRALLDARD